MAEKRPPLTGSQAFARAKQEAGIKSYTTFRAWCEMWPEMVVARYLRLTLIDPDKFEQFLAMRPRQGVRWTPPPDPRPRRKREGEGGHDLHD